MTEKPKNANMEQLNELTKILAGTPNDVIFDATYRDALFLMAEGHEHDEADLDSLVVTVTEGCRYIRRQFGRVSRSWSKAEKSAMPALNRLSDRALIQEFCANSEPLMLPMILLISAFGTILVAAKGERELPLLELYAKTMIGDFSRKHIIAQVSIVRKFEYIAAWDQEYRARCEVITDTLNFYRKEDGKVARAVENFIETFNTVQNAMFAIYLQKVQSGRL